MEVQVITSAVPCQQAVAIPPEGPFMLIFQLPVPHADAQAVFGALVQALDHLGVRGRCGVILTTDNPTVELFDVVDMASLGWVPAERIES